MATAALPKSGVLRGIASPWLFAFSMPIQLAKEEAKDEGQALVGLQCLKRRRKFVGFISDPKDSQVENPVEGMMTAAARIRASISMSYRTKEQARAS